MDKELQAFFGRAKRISLRPQERKAMWSKLAACTNLERKAGKNRHKECMKNAGAIGLRPKEKDSVQAALEEHMQKHPIEKKPAGFPMFLRLTPLYAPTLAIVLFVILTQQEDKIVPPPLPMIRETSSSSVPMTLMDEKVDESKEKDPEDPKDPDEDHPFVGTDPEEEVESEPEPRPTYIRKLFPKLDRDLIKDLIRIRETDQLKETEDGSLIRSHKQNVFEEKDIEPEPKKSNYPLPTGSPRRWTPEPSMEPDSEPEPKPKPMIPPSEPEPEPVVDPEPEPESEPEPVSQPPEPEPIPPTEEQIGGQRDEYGCLGPAGYSYDAELRVCLRIWEITDAMRPAVRIAVNHTRPSYGLTVIAVRQLRCIGCFVVILQKDNGRQTEVTINNWEVQ